MTVHTDVPDALEAACHKTQFAPGNPFDGEESIVTEEVHHCAKCIAVLVMVGQERFGCVMYEGELALEETSWRDHWNR